MIETFSFLYRKHQEKLNTAQKKFKSSLDFYGKGRAKKPINKQEYGSICSFQSKYKDQIKVRILF